MPAAVAPTLAGSPAFIPCLIGILLVAALGALEGGYFPTTWYPAALFVLALLALSLAIVREATRPPAAVLAAVALLFLYALWSYASIAWADDQGTAVDGAGRALMYALIFGLFALRPIAGGPALALLGAYGLAVGGIGIVELVRIDAAADPAGYFLDKRLAQPLGYHNGDVAFWFSGFWPCAFLASRREVAPLLRALLLACAGTLLGLALLGQSRGWFFSLPVAAVAFVALVPGRGRAVGVLAALAAAGLAIREPLLRVHDKFVTGSGLAPLVDDAARAIALAALCLAAVGLVAALLDRRITPTPRAARLASAGVVALAGLAVAAGAAALIAKEAHPIDSLRDSWREFKTGDLPQTGEPRFTSSLGSGRYDIWRVAWQRFREEPLTGIGADNFQQDYLQRARTLERPRYPHSLELRILSQTGLVGGLLLLLAFAATGVAAARARLRGPPLTRVAVGGALAVTVYWLVHGSVDWFWEVPALGGAAFAFLGLAAGSAPRAERTAGAGLPAAVRIALWGAAAAAAAALALPWLAERDVGRAADVWPRSPDAAFQRLDRAKALNPLASRPYLYEGAIALRLGRVRQARDSFREALERNPRDWYGTLELGAIASVEGDQRTARRLLARASRLLPRDEATRAAIRRVRSGKAVDVRGLSRQLREDARKLVDPR